NAEAEPGSADLSEMAAHHFEEYRAGGGRRVFAQRLHRGRVGEAGAAGAIAGAAEVDGEDGVAHPFTPEATMESTKKRWRMTKSSTGGSTARVAPAMTRPVFMAPRL